MKKKKKKEKFYNRTGLSALVANREQHRTDQVRTYNYQDKISYRLQVD